MTKRRTTASKQHLETKGQRLGPIKRDFEKLTDDFVARAIPAADDSFPETLYHYTKADAFISILSSAKMRATHYAHLNDREEYKGGLTLIDSALRSLSKHEIAFSDIHDTILRGLQRDASHPESPYVISFTEKGNQLSQWRAYADNGAGYSFGLRSLTLMHVGGELQQCVYSNAVFESEVRKRYAAVQRAALTYLAKVQRLKQPGTMASAQAEITALFAANMQTLASAYKSHAFDEEHEWRIVLRTAVRGETPRPPFFRGSPRGIVPYLECDIRGVDHKVPLTRVYVGPTQDPSVGVAAARLLLESIGFSDTAQLVVGSGIPFRQ